MFDIGFSELVLIGVIALLVVGPEKLPHLARQAGSWIGKIKRFVNSTRADIEQELKPHELKRALNEQQNEISQLKGMISDAQNELQETGHSVKEIEARTAVHARRSSVERTKTGDSTESPRPYGLTTDHDPARSTRS